MSRGRAEGRSHHHEKSATEPVGPVDAPQEFENGEPQDPNQAALDTMYQVMAKLTEERDLAKDQLLRAMAEMQTQRRRLMAEKEAFAKVANEDLIRDLLPVLDNFERTLAAAKTGASLEALIEGVSLVDRQLRTVLETRDFKRIATEGVLFDPNLHEAVVAEETEEHPEGTILLELSPGYQLAETVIRPSKVKVAKGP
ncbi:MAG: nucleotide exchange factor GrpE [Armatimonadetes bacterium]|nr:nucleotide exchange factor GrpE [Armatimonadota bacterium]